jgi:hypothetical protein
LEASKRVYTLLCELCPTKLKWLTGALRNVLPSLYVTRHHTHGLREASNALTRHLTGDVICATDIAGEGRLTLSLKWLIISKRQAFGAIQKALEVRLGVLWEVGLGDVLRCGGRASATSTDPRQKIPHMHMAKRADRVQQNIRRHLSPLRDILRKSHAP